jgi:glucosamine-6-phosphate deaminase
MEVVPCAGEEEVAVLAADAVAVLVRRRPGAVLGVATGSSPARLYRELGRRRRAGDLSLAGVTVFLLDEYVGLPAGHPASYREEIRHALTPAGVPGDRVHAPDGAATDLAGEAVRYEAAIAAAGGVDLQVVGIGANGHLAFNEPSSSLGSRTRVKTLTARTRADNARFFASPEEVPTHVLTQGLGTIRDARHVVLLALGERKAAALAAAVEGPVTARCPASVLQLHPHVTVLVDPPAAARLQDLDHYRHVWRHKPPWQGL